MPWEETEDFIRSGHRDPDICQQGSQRTITISQDQGIEAVICRPHGKDSTVVQSFLFPKAKGWTMSKAKQWFQEHQRGSLAGMSLHYVVKAEAVERDGKKFAFIEVIDESECRNKWRINPAGKTRALESLMSTPLLGPPTAGHEAFHVVGRPYDFTSNYATSVLYEILVEDDWKRIESGEWGPVSPELQPLMAHYEDETLIVDEWRWNHVAFVEKGAFPNTGVKSTCEDDPRLCSFSKALTAAVSQSRLEATRWPRTETDVGAYSPEKGKQGSREKTRGPPGGVTMEKDNECEEKIAELTDAKNTVDAELKDAKAKLTELTGANKTLDAEIKELKAKPTAPAADVMAIVQAELKALKAENETLKAWKQAQEEADHMSRVQAVIDRRVKAGLLDVKNVQAAVESLRKLPNDALDAMKADLEAVQGKFDSLPSGPKARLIPSVAARFDPMQPTVGDLVGKKPGEK